MPKYEIEMNGQIMGMIEKQLTFLRPKYEINYNGWRVEGDFLGWDYRVMSGNRTIMHIQKELFRWGDTYVIDFENPEDELLGLLLVIAIDAANCQDNK